MNEHCKRILTAFVLLAASVWVLSAEDKGSHRSGYQFESEPRAVLAEAKITSSNDPKVALRASGAVYLLAVYKVDGSSQLGLAISHDGGDTFAPPVPISERSAQVSSHGENSPSLAFGSAEAYVLWEQTTKAGGTDLMFARSLSFGQSFEKPTRVTDKKEPSPNLFSYLAVAPNGHIYAVWLDGRDRQEGPSGTFAVYLAKSTDRGVTFGKNVRVATGACPCCRPSLAFGSAGEVFVAWRTVFEGDIRDMVVAKSSDNGETFQAPVRVAVDNWKISGCPHSGPAMVRKGSRLYVAWYTEGDGEQAAIKLAWSDNGAKSFAPPVTVSGSILDPNHPAFSVSEEGRVLLVFQGRDPVKKEGWSPARAYLTEISDTGTVSPPVPAPGNQKGISYPAVAAGTVGRVFIAWTEPDQNGRRIMLSRGRRSQ